jgi:hypothetical protein
MHQRYWIGKLAWGAVAGRLGLLSLALVIALGEQAGYAQSVISTFAGSNRAFTADGTVATTLAISRVSFVTLSPQGNLVFAIPELNVVVEVNSDGTVTHIAGTGASGNSGDGGQATAATLRAPTGVAYDSLGNLYITDMFNNSVRQVTPGGVITTFAGNGIGKYAGDNGPAKQASLYYPSSIAVDKTNNIIYINDAYNKVIHVRRRVCRRGHL